MLFPHSSLPHIWRYVPLAVMQVPLKVSYNLLPFTNCITYIHNLSIRQLTTFSKSDLMFFFIFCHSLCDNLCLAKSVVPRSGAPMLHHFPTPCWEVYQGRNILLCKIREWLNKTRSSDTAKELRISITILIYIILFQLKVI